jgi:UDP-glucose 4-epimerase
MVDSGIKDIFERYNFEYVFHFGAYAAEGLSGFKRNFFHSNNILSTGNIINNCVNFNVKRLVFTSSMSVYGDYGDRRLDENDIPHPLDPYAIGKYTNELDIQSAGHQFGLDWCIIRPHNVYGPNQNIWDKYRNVLGIWMNQIINKKPTTIYGRGDSVRAFTYIDDILPCILRAAVDSNCSKEIINLGGTKEYSIQEAHDILEQIVGKVDTEYLEPRYEVKHAVPTYEKSVKFLGFKDNTSLYDGLKKMWEWAVNQPNREIKSWDSFEIGKQLYSYWK